MEGRKEECVSVVTSKEWPKDLMVVFSSDAIHVIVSVDVSTSFTLSIPSRYAAVSSGIELAARIQRMRRDLVGLSSLSFGSFFSLL